MALANFQPNTKLTASALNNAINSQCVNGSLTVVPRFGGTNAGITGNFGGNFSVLFGRVAVIQVRCDFTGLGSGSGELVLDVSGAGLPPANGGPNQRIDVAGVVGFNIVGPLYGYVVSQTSSYHFITDIRAENASRVFGRAQFAGSTAAMTLSATYGVA